MSILTEEGERINPSLRDIKILIALSDHEQNTYQISRRVENDSNSDQAVSNGAIRPAIERLNKVGLIEPHKSPGYYQLTSFGRTILEVELRRLETIIKLAKKRLQN